MEENTKELDNSALISAIEEMRENFTPETQNKVINTALRSTFLVPGIKETGSELIADENNHLTFNDEPRVRFILINDKEQHSYFPVFTSKDELLKLTVNEEYTAFSMTFADIAGLTENAGEQVYGFVVNPYNENLPFTQGMLANIKQILINAVNEKKENQENVQSDSDNQN